METKKFLQLARQGYGLFTAKIWFKSHDDDEQKPPSFSTVLEHVRRYPPKLCLLARHCAEPYSPMRTSPEIPSAPIDPVNT